VFWQGSVQLLNIYRATISLRLMKSLPNPERADEMRKSRFTEAQIIGMVRKQGSSLKQTIEDRS
jgi:hypothetical protein